MLSLAAPWALALLPLPWLVWRFAPPHREQVSALRIPFFRQVTEAAEVEGQAGAAVLTRSRFQMIAASADPNRILRGKGCSRGEKDFSSRSRCFHA